MTISHFLQSSTHLCPAPGIPDLLQILVKLTQTAMAEKLTFVNDLQVGLGGGAGYRRGAGCWLVPSNGAQCWGWQPCAPHCYSTLM